MNPDEPIGTWGEDGHEHEWENYPNELQSKALTGMEKCKHCSAIRRNPFKEMPLKEES